MIKSFSVAAWKRKQYFRCTVYLWEVACVLSRGRGKWVLESRWASEQLSAEGNLILMPDRAQSPLCGCLEKRLPGRLCPIINFDQIFTVHHMACLTSHSHFSRPGFEQFGAICVPFGWTRAMSHSAGPCWCLWDLATQETGSTES